MFLCLDPRGCATGVSFYVLSAKMDEANPRVLFTNCTVAYLVALMANSCKIPAAHKGFGLLGGTARLCPKEVLEMFRSW